MIEELKEILERQQKLIDDTLLLCQQFSDLEEEVTEIEEEPCQI